MKNSNFCFSKKLAKETVCFLNKSYFSLEFNNFVIYSRFIKKKLSLAKDLYTKEIYLAKFSQYFVRIYKCDKI